MLVDGVPLVRRRRLSVGVLIALAVIAWCFASWLLAERLVSERTNLLIEREQDAVSSAAAAVGANAGFALAHMSHIPKVLARQPEIETILARLGSGMSRISLAPPQLRGLLEKDAGLSRLAKRLEAMVADLGVDQVMVIDDSGNCIASGGFPRAATATGVNYLDREYFTKAKRDGVGQQFAVGRTTRTPGIFYSAAVTSGSRFLGVIAVKIDVSRLARLVSDANAFITDENGVVIIAGDRGFYMKSVPGAWVKRLSEGEQLRRYQRREFETLAIEPVDVHGIRLVRLEGRRAPMLEALSYSQADMLKIWVFRDLSELLRIQREGRWLWLVLLVAGASLIASVGAAIRYLRRGREHQVEIARINEELVALNDELKVHACFDSLTGCRNRRYFLEEVDNELKRSARFAFPCCVAVLDIDHFKAVNDEHGHAAGDVLLKHFAQTVGACLRSSDSLGRLGGEEFALLLPQTTLEGAVELAERVRSAVECSSVRDGVIEVRVTASIGVERWRGADDSVESLLVRADHAMYAAKHDGRNRVNVQATSSNLSLFADG
ncbi:MAG: diguanylate cyclase [Proteobacteria bacterium]|nr:diguanylate cyclase [Pseudomonadota bacterium]